MIRQESIEHRSAHAPTERIVRVPDAYERPGGLRASVAPWMIFFAVGMIAAVAVFAIVLSRGPGVGGTPPADGGGSVNAEPALDAYRTHTVNVDGGIDLLSLAPSPSSLLQYHGAPITADGVVVNEIFGPDAFTVASPSGAEMLVYVAPQGDTGLIPVTPGSRLTFLATLMPVRPDFQFLVGPAAVPAALPAGAYLYAVPETISILTTQAT